MAAPERTELIESLLNSMVNTAEARRYISRYEGLVAPWEIEPLKIAAEQSEAQYRNIVARLGGIPVRMILVLEEPETDAKITALHGFKDGLWSYQYQVGNEVAPEPRSSTPQTLLDAFKASIMEKPDNPHS